jgi:hypothetical protein
LGTIRALTTGEIPVFRVFSGLTVIVGRGVLTQAARVAVRAMKRSARAARAKTLSVRLQDCPLTASLGKAEVIGWFIYRIRCVLLKDIT